ncbi:hypothetical protein C922_05362 [Plasmodium inui San Antonio 1]|uniref:Pv-fam-d protein n=1 Tax=Plasmodium inui San Antonio 1 TaxID=1237626 RepID=W6ZY93_9APIC|nr:hypothetical protein C922_05362 [Plasmodium inui San Antonio 1]EUD64260.1 hypothetical protein C922_05362 [Plasmodium inui San Antonio 1]
MSWHYSRERITHSGESEGKGLNPSILLNLRTSRLLRGEADLDYQDKYDPLNDKIMQIADDNDYTSERRLKSMMKDNEFNTQFNTTNSNESVQKWDNSHDSYESFPNHDEVFDSSRSIDNSDESSVEINYHDENDLDAEDERGIYNTLKNNVPHYIQVIYTIVLFNMFAVVTVIATLIIIPFLPFLALFLYLFYKCNNCKYLTVLFESCIFSGKRHLG